MDRDRELELVARLRAGDTAAFDEVHAEHNARLFNFLARLAGNRDVAEDLLEETWLRFVTHTRRLRSDTRLGAWLFTVARHLHVSYRRSRALEDAQALGMLSLWPTGAPGDSPLAIAEAGESQRRLAAALGSLPAIYREALWLVAVEGFRHAEAAAICEVTAETMRQRVSRGRTLLARRLAELETPAFATLREVTT